MFCLHLLTNASLAGPSGLKQFQHYQILAADLRPLLRVREQQAAEKALRKNPYRPRQKPLAVSQIQLITNLGAH